MARDTAKVVERDCELTSNELNQASGEVNPQPLPPG